MTDKRKSTRRTPSDFDLFDMWRKLPPAGQETALAYVLELARQQARPAN